MLVEQEKAIRKYYKPVDKIDAKFRLKTRAQIKAWNEELEPSQK